MKAILTLIVAVSAATLSAQALAAPEISGTVAISNNKAQNINVGGGSAGGGKLPFVGDTVHVDLTSVANINSLVMNDTNAKVSGTVAIKGNDARDVLAIGGTANVNSVVMGK